MNVVSHELCKELFKLSGWDNVTHIYYEDSVLRQVEDARTHVATPAYDLGYLLRKLPTFANEDGGLTIWKMRGGSWTIGYPKNNNVLTKGTVFANKTLEDAACKLAIELFKQGILTKEQKKG